MQNNKKIKILCVSVMQAWGGGEECLYQLIKNLHDCEFVMVSPEAPLLDKLSGFNLKIYLNNYFKKIYNIQTKGSLFTKIKIFLNVIISNIFIIKAILKEHPDIILANGNFAALYTCFGSALLKKKLIVIQHLIYNHSSFETKIIPVIYRFSKLFICVSGSVRKNLEPITGKNSLQKLIVIYNGLEMPAEVPAVNNLEKPLNVGMAGAIIRVKAIDLVIKTLEELLIAGEIKIHLFGIPTKEPDSISYRDELRHYIAGKKLENSVIFHGQVPDKKGIYARIDVLINFSRQAESFSFSVAEAMSYGKIVIAKNEGGPAELIKPGLNGFLVNNEPELKSTVEFILKELNSDKLMLVKAEAAGHIRSNFNITNFIYNYREAFKKIL